jgi:diguanylate cyclase (GGDEF)-like protein
MRFNSLISRIVVFFVILITLVQVLAFFFVNTANSSNAKQKIAQELDAGERIFQRLLEQNRSQLTQAAMVLTADYAFREAVATNDVGTVTSVLKNHGDRIRASAMMLLSPQNELLADTLHPDANAAAFSFAPVVAAALKTGDASAIVVIDDHLYQFVVVPVLAPLPIALVAIGFVIDDKLAKDLQALTSLQVSFLAKRPAQSWNVFATTLTADLRELLPAALPRQSGLADPTVSMPLLGDDYQTRIVRLQQQDETAIVAVLQRSLKDALAAFNQLRGTLLALLLISLAASVVGSYLIARTITRPLRSLTQSATKMQQGDYTEPIDIRQNDEIGVLATSLNYMRKGIASRESEILRLAYQDTLTGLPNRALFNDRLTQATALAKRRDMPLSVLMIDLDRFKYVNDTLGHAAGDEVLCEVGKRLRTVLRESDTIARLGGDEFAILLPDADAGMVMRVVYKILQALEAPIQLGEQWLDVGGSAGIASYPQHSDDPGTLMRYADMAMYVAKRNNSGSAFYDPNLDDTRRDHLSLLGELRRAVEKNELLLYYQPKIELLTNRVVGLEALVRWQHPDRGFVPPSEFIPFAERTGYIKVLTQWIIEGAMRQCGRWVEQGIWLETSLNISARDLVNAELPNRIHDAMQTYRVPPELVCLEITESGFMDDPMRALQTLTRLNALGTKLSVDDYGTGYSSLAYLKKLPVGEMKIDQTFVRNMILDSDDLVIVRSTIELGHNLGLKVVAEGVEDKATLDKLNQFGCDLAQGYYISRPLPPEQVELWLNVPNFAAA